MPISVHLDENRVISCHKIGMSMYLIGKRFGCSPEKIRNILVRNGFDPKVIKKLIVISPVAGVTRRCGQRPGLGD